MNLTRQRDVASNEQTLKQVIDMNIADIKAELSQLRKEIRRHNRLYYELDAAT